TKDNMNDFNLFASTVINLKAAETPMKQTHSHVKRRGRLNQMIIHMVRHRPGMTLDFTLFSYFFSFPFTLLHRSSTIVKEKSVKISCSLLFKYVYVCERCD